MALTDPRSVIREILSRRPDLHQAFAPRLEAMGVQVAGPSFSGETRRRLDAANNPFSPTIAGRPPTPPPTGFPATPPGPGLTATDMAIPFGGTGGDPNSLSALAGPARGFGRQDYKRGPVDIPPTGGLPSQASDVAQRLFDARMMQGSAKPMPGIAEPGRSVANVEGKLPADFMSPSSAFSGNLPRTRPPQELSSLGPSSPLGGAVPPSPLSALGPQPSLPGVGPPSPIIGREAPPGLNGPPSPLASRFGDQSQLPGGAFSGSLPRPPQPRPFESMIAARPEGPPSGFPATPPLAGGPTPQQLAAAKEQVQQIAALRPPTPQQPVAPTSSLPPMAPDQRLANMPGTGPPSPLSPQLAAAAALRAGVPPTTAADLSPQDLRASLDITAGSPAPTTSSLPRPRPTIDIDAASQPAVGAVPPVAPISSQNIPAPEPVGVPPMLASVGPPNPARMNVVANYTGEDEPAAAAAGVPPVMSPTVPGVNVDTVRARGFGDITTFAPDTAPVHRYGSGTGKWAGAALGALKGLPAGPAGVGVGGFLGYKAGKKVGGLADRDFGLGTRFTNPNYAQGLTRNAPPLENAPAQPPGILGRLFGGMRGMRDKKEHLAEMVRAGIITPQEAMERLSGGMSGIFGGGGGSASAGGNWGSNSGYGGGYGGGGYQGGSYGGYGGSNINQGIGQRFGQR